MANQGRNILRTQYFSDELAAYNKKFLALYEGIVEDVSDPLNLGRVRARIAGIHDTEKTDIVAVVSPTEDLPWAFPCFVPGTFIVPQVGDAVWIMFRQGNPDYPVYLGTWYGITEADTIKGRLPGKGAVPQKTQVAAPGEAQAPGANNTVSYTVPAGIEVPEEAYQHKQTLDPTVNVIHKSPRGATIYEVMDSGSERFVFADRMGQIFEFNSPVTPQAGQHNGNPRGVREAKAGESPGAVPLGVAVGGSTFIRMTDAAGQLVKLTAKQGSAEIEIAGPSGTFVKLEQSGEKISAVSKKKGQVVIDDNILIQSAAGGKGEVHIDPTGNIDVTGLEITITGTDVTINGAATIALKAPIITLEGIVEVN